MKTRIPPIPNLHFQNNTDSFLLIAGPCVVESEEIVISTANQLCILSEKHQIPFVFKSSYRKANRSRGDSFTGIGDSKALKILSKVREHFSIPVLTDIHNPAEAEMAAEYVDVLQIPAFLCRQTDLLTAAANTGKWINIKKGQFLSGEAMRFPVEKIRSAGNRNIILTERGTTFGYQDLVVDFRNIPEMQKNEVPVIVDITHSLQQPNQKTGISGGNPRMVETIGRAAVAVGADGVFVETHPDPDQAKSDAESMLKLNDMGRLLLQLIDIKKAVNRI